MTKEKPTDYAAIIRAANAATPQLSEGIKLGQQIQSSQYGIGEVISLLGKSIVVKFPKYSVPKLFKDWQLLIESGEIVPMSPASTTKEIIADKQLTLSRVSLTEIQTIPQPKFRAIATELADSLTAIEITLPLKGEIYSIPKDLPESLQIALKKNHITNFYGHQIEALTQLRSGKDLSIATPTASGKTLCYNPAIIESCLNYPETSALYIFPLKALIVDQMRKLQKLINALPLAEKLKIGEITGDTPSSERKKLFIPNPPDILILNPDLLHHQLEKVRKQSEWQPWREFLRRLRWVVIDESHTYIGAFGAHFANLMRRLRRAVDSVGGNSDNIQFICASATIGNPSEMALRFSGRSQKPERLHLIEDSKSGNAGRTIICLEPSNAANVDACKIVLSWLQSDLSGIVFCNSRAAVKSLLSLIQRQSNKQNIGYLGLKVVMFYGSLKGDRRRNIIQQLQTGEVKVILSTSALEAGIDLPELDCCLVRGYPGSIMSFRQRIGRAGRKNPGLTIFLPVAQNRLDDYYGSYPKQLLSGEVEKAAFNPDYPTILSKHLECCGVESGLPLTEIDSLFGASAGAIAEELLSQNKLFLSSRGILWGQGYPHANINIRGNTQNSSIELIDKNTGESFEEMQNDLAYREVFPGAIYTASDQQGSLITYCSESLNIETQKAVLKPIEPDDGIFTQAETDLKIDFLQDLEAHKIISTTFPEGRLRLRLGWGEITSLVTGYKLLNRKDQQTCSNSNCNNYHEPLTGYKCSSCGYKLRFSEITQVKQTITFKEPYRHQYQAPILRIEVNPGIINGISTEVNRLKAIIKSQNNQIIPEDFKTLLVNHPEFIALHSIGHQIQFAVPLVVLSSSHDVSCIVEKQGERTFGYFFDTCEGGNGAAEAIFKDLAKFANKAQLLAKTCSCSDGCPKCLIQHGCPQQNEGLHKKLGLSLLDAICQSQ